MRPSTRTVTVVPAGPANLNGWGFKWPVGFQLSGKENELGWIVQKVTIRFRTWTKDDHNKTVFHYDKILLADGKFLDKPVETYWEVWPVPADQTAVYWPAKDELAPSLRLAPFPDEYLVAPDPDLGEEKSRGEVKVVGTVAFYLGKLPASFNQQRETTSGVLPSTTTEPEFWTGKGTAHNLLATWNTLSDKVSFRLWLTPTPEGNPRFAPKDVDWNAW
jgi:hypothetical protein